MSTVKDTDFDDDQESATYRPTGPQKTVNEYAELGESQYKSRRIQAGLTDADANDNSLKKWKESIGISSSTGQIIHDPTNDNKVLLETISLHSPGRPPIDLSISSPESLAKLATSPFTVKEGVRYQMVIKFRIQREVVSGLKYLQVVKRKGIRVDKFEEMIGSYGPSQQMYEKKLAEEEAPSGMLARGEYRARSRFVDDDKYVHLDFEFAIIIAKDWKA